MSAIARNIKSGQVGEILRPVHFRRSDHPGARFARATPPVSGGELPVAEKSLLFYLGTVQVADAVEVFPAKSDAVAVIV